MTDHPFRILLVEDDPADAMLARRAMEEAIPSAQISHAKDGVDCMRRLRRQPPDYADALRPNLILLDLNMPRMDGREVLQQLKSDQDLRDIPVVVLTTSDFEQDIVGSYKLGANSFVTKPMDIDDFIQSVRTLGDYWLKVVKLPHYD